MSTDPAESPLARALAYFGQFGVDESLIRAALAAALSRGGDFADLYFQHRVAHSLGLEDGAVNRAWSGVELGVGVRVVRGDQTGYGYTENLSTESVRQAALTAAAIADGPFQERPLPHWVVSTLPQRYPAQTPWDRVAAETRLPLLQQVHELAHAADPRIQKVTVHFSDEEGAVLLVDSQGRVSFDEQPMTLIHLSCTAEENGKRESNGGNIAGRAGLEFYTQAKLEKLVSEAVERTTILFQAVPAPAGEMPVVLGAGSSGILLHEAIGHGLEADFNRKGVSIYADKLGKAIAQPFVTVVDDATQIGARGAINVDDEGNPAGLTTLIHEGILETYLHDSISARHFGVAPTGNGRRESFRHAPLPRMRSTYMQNGPHTPEEIIASVDRGIYCQHFANGQVQIGAGDFTFYVKNGWLIENGKLTRPVKDVNLIGNGPKVLELVDMVGNDLKIDDGGWTCGKDGQSVPVSQGMPTTRVGKMTVGGRG